MSAPTTGDRLVYGATLVAGSVTLGASLLDGYPFAAVVLRTALAVGLGWPW